MTQKYQVKVSMKQAAIVETGIVLKQGDFGMQIEIEVLDFDATGTTPQIVFRKAMGAVESTTITVSGNKYTYTFKGTELDTPGKVFCDLKLKNSTTQRISTASFMFKVVADTMDGLAEEASSYSDTIEQLLGDVVHLSATPGLVKNDGTIDQNIQGNVIDLTNAAKVMSTKDGIVTVGTNMIFQRGRLDADGTIKTAIYRIVNTDIAQFDYDVIVSCAEGYNFNLCFYNENNVFSQYIEYSNAERVIPQNTKFRICVKAIPEDTSSAADINLFSSNAYMSINKQELNNTIKGISNQNNVPVRLNMIFQRGRLDADGTIKTAIYRIVNTDIAQFDYDVILSMTPGYRIVVALYNADNSLKERTSFLTSDYKITKNQKFRVQIGLINEDTSLYADIKTFSSNVFMSTVSASEIKRIKDNIYSPLKKCGSMEDYGKTINISDCTLTATNVEVLDSKKTKFSETSKLVRIKKLNGVTNYELNIQLPETVNADRFFLTVKLSDNTANTSTGSYFEIKFNSSNNVVGRSNGPATIQTWNHISVAFSSTVELSNIKLVFSIRNNVQDNEYCGSFWIDSVTINSRMKPTFLLNFDQWWQDSIDNGGYQYCFDNNIPFTLMTKNYDQLSATFLNLAKEAEELHGCENGYYASYGPSNSSLLNAASYDVAVNEVGKMKNDFANAFGHLFNSFGCTQMLLNKLDRNALRDNNIKMIRGAASQMMSYFDKDDYIIQTRGISSDSNTLADVKSMIDKAVTHGYCMLAFTHGICDDGQTMMAGSTSNGINITDFKAMIDYLVSLRSQGKIQICTLQDWYNQCTNLDYIDK